MTDSQADYIKQIEEENEKLRNQIKDTDDVVGDFFRKLGEIRKSSGVMDMAAKWYFHVSSDPIELTEKQLEMLRKMDIVFFKPAELPSMSINDIVGVQPMMNPQTFQDVLKWSTGGSMNIGVSSRGVQKPKPGVGSFSNVKMPKIGKTLTDEEIEEEVSGKKFIPKVKTPDEMINENIKLMQKEKNHINYWFPK